MALTSPNIIDIKVAQTFLSAKKGQTEMSAPPYLSQDVKKERTNELLFPYLTFEVEC
jgi:hypothetical protein